MKLSTILFLLPLLTTAQPPLQKSLFGQPAHAGIYLMNVYDLSLDENSYYADFYLWFKWKGDIDASNIEFVNALEKWGMTMTNFEDSIILLADGSSYQGFRVEGRFAHPFILERFPLDVHELQIHVENPDYPLDSLVYLPDTAAAHNPQPGKWQPPRKATRNLFRPELNLAGWKIQGASLSSKAHAYGTDFGNPDNPAETFSDLVFTFTIARPVSYFLLKLLLPLTIVMFAAFGALLFFPSYVDARISLPVGSLLTAVFLQQGYTSALPDVGYMVLMDKIYLLAFALIAAVMLQLILTGNRMRLLKKDKLAMEMLKKRERMMAALYLLIYVAGVGLLVAWT